MRKPISPQLHGLIDYMTAATTAAAPRLLDFSGPASRACDTLAGGYGSLAAVTDYPPALRRTVPLKVHGALDVALGLMLPALPWLLGFARDRRARNFFLGLAAVSAVVTALTDWEAGGEPA